MENLKVRFSIAESDPTWEDLIVNRKFPTLEEERNFNTKICLIQQWFIRFSWPQKLDFVCSLMRYMKPDVLRELMLTIGPPTKDVIYAKVSVSLSPLDRPPFDTNRTLDLGNIELFKEKEIKWILELDDIQQVDIVLDLLSLGGPVFKNEIFNRGLPILQNFHRQSIRKMSKELKDAVRKCSIIEKKKSLENLPIDLTELSKTDRKKKRRSTSARTADKLSLALLKWVKALRDCEVDSDDQVQEGQKDKPEIKEGSQDNWKLDPRSRTVDQMELLPIWLNRYILKKLPKEELNSKCPKISPYWESVANKIKKEEIQRNRLNILIMRLEFEITAPNISMKLNNNEMSAKRGFTQITEKVEAPKRRYSTLSLDSSQDQKNRKNFSMRRTSSSCEFFHNYEDEIKTREEIINIIPKLLEKAKPRAYGGLYKTFVLDDEFSSERIMGVNRRWLATSRSDKDPNSISLVNLETGGKTSLELNEIDSISKNPRKTWKTIPYEIFNSPSVLFFNPSEDEQLLVGRPNGDISLWDINSKNIIRKYFGFKENICGLTGNDCYMAANNKEKIRVFTWDNPIVVWEIITPSVITSSTMTYMDSLYIGNKEGEIICYDIKNKYVVQVINWAHWGEVTDLSAHDSLLLSSGVDGYVKVWNRETNETRTLISIFHRERINKVYLSNLNVLSACENGKIYVWDILKNELKEKISINLDGMPIVDMAVVESTDISKIVTLNESRIMMHQFSFKSTTSAGIGKKKGPDIKLKPRLPLGLQKIELREGKFSRREKGLRELEMRWCNAPGIVNPKSVATKEHRDIFKSKEESIQELEEDLPRKFKFSEDEDFKRNHLKKAKKKIGYTTNKRNF